MSKSHINPAALKCAAFEQWYADQVGAMQKTKGVDAKVLLRESIKQLDWRLLPFVTWDKQAPTRVKVTIQGTEYKGILVMNVGVAWHKIGIGFQSKAGRGGTHLHLKVEAVTRYRRFRSKRWRSPKEFHEAMSAYYMLKFR